MGESNPYSTTRSREIVARTKLQPYSKRSPVIPDLSSKPHLKRLFAEMVELYPQGAKSTGAIIELTKRRRLHHPRIKHYLECLRLLGLVSSTPLVSDNGYTRRRLWRVRKCVYSAATIRGAVVR